MSSDHSIDLLAQYAREALCIYKNPKLLIIADENSLNEMDTYSTIHPNTHLISNRFDVVKKAQQHKMEASFNDFIFADLPSSYACIIYRISKEKPVTHHIFNQILSIATQGTTLIIAGQKNEGIKNYTEKLKRLPTLNGTSKKHGNDYIAKYRVEAIDSTLPPFPFDDSQYTEFKKINSLTLNALDFHITSKPGVFGWNKIDEGSQFLSDVLIKQDIIKPKNKINALDLGCGYGYLTLFAASLGIKDIVATDNNAAAISATKHNIQINNIAAHTVADDCAGSISDTFSLILCNPPFHQGFTIDSHLTQRFIQSAKNHLRADGKAYFVTNAFIGIEKLGAQYFNHSNILANNKKFKVLEFFN